jgi:uncharacterized protein (TIGR03083 family)
MLDYLDHLKRDGAIVAGLARDGDLAAPVPSCPGWTLADLVGHLGTVYRIQGARAGAGSAERLDPPRPKPPATGLADWYDESFASIVDVLEATDPGAPAWNWAPDEPKVAAFWRRRMAQETLVHRWDAEAAVGAPGPLDPELAADGVDEWLTAFLGADVADPKIAVPDHVGTLHVHCTDASGEWVASLSGRDLQVRREHAKADVAARGPAADLLLVLWRRLPASSVDVVGDPAVLDAWLAFPDN